MVWDFGLVNVASATVRDNSLSREWLERRRREIHSVGNESVG
jgi:hypothetical protein